MTHQWQEEEAKEILTQCQWERLTVPVNQTEKGTVDSLHFNYHKIKAGFYSKEYKNIPKLDVKARKTGWDFGVKIGTSYVAVDLISLTLVIAVTCALSLQFAVISYFHFLCLPSAGVQFPAVWRWGQPRLAHAPTPAVAAVQQPLAYAVSKSGRQNYQGIQYILDKHTASPRTADGQHKNILVSLSDKREFEQNLKLVGTKMNIVTAKFRYSDSNLF